VPLRVCSYEDRPEAMDSLILMGESLCRADQDVSLHLTVPDAPASVRAWVDTRPQVILSATRPDGVSGWDVKPWLLLQELNAGNQETLWLDDDMIVTRSISSLLKAYPPDSLIVSEEWGQWTVPVSHFWELPSARPVPLINACVVRATQAHRPLLERWLHMIRSTSYRDAQKMPFERRPKHLLHDGWLMVALLESAEFGEMPYECLRVGHDIAQCAGLSGYRPAHRFLDLFRGLPALIHGLGRKPWESAHGQNGIHRFMLDLATDVSPYVLAARAVAKDLDMTPAWLEARTAPGTMLRRLSGGHPALAGLPLAVVHALYRRIGR
jgi:hypothetical protein